MKLELAEAEVRAESNMLRAAQLVEELRAEQGNASRAETEKKEVEVGKEEKLKLFMVSLARPRLGSCRSMWKRRRQEQSSGEIRW